MSTLITDKDFNLRVKKWADECRMSAYYNILSGKQTEGDYRDGNTLEANLGANVRVVDGIAARVSFSFPEHGVYFHYGVGRGYVRTGGSVVRAQKVFKGKLSHSKTGRKLQISKGYKMSGSDINRKPVNWLDSVIKNNIGNLADLAQEFYGDKAFQSVLSQVEKLGISKGK